MNDLLFWLGNIYLILFGSVIAMYTGYRLGKAGGMRDDNMV